MVPSSRLGRMLSFGSLAAGLGVGTAAQYVRNTLQSVSGRPEPEHHAFLSPANAERIVDTLCKVRGESLATSLYYVLMRNSRCNVFCVHFIALHSERILVLFTVCDQLNVY